MIDIQFLTELYAIKFSAERRLNDLIAREEDHIPKGGEGELINLRNVNLMHEEQTILTLDKLICLYLQGFTEK